MLGLAHRLAYNASAMDVRLRDRINFHEYVSRGLQKSRQFTFTWRLAKYLNSRTPWCVHNDVTIHHL